MIEDDMKGILEKIAETDVLILGSPVNYGSVTALTKRFMERLGPALYTSGWLPLVNEIPRSRMLRDMGPRKGVALVTCYTPSFIRFPLGEFRIAVKQLNISLGVTGHKDEELFVGGAMLWGVSRRKRLRGKARELGRSLAEATTR